MMYLGMFTLVILPMFLIISAQTIRRGENDHAGRNIAAAILYVCAAATVVTGIALIYIALN